VDAFDADGLIYAAVRGHQLGRRVRALSPVEATATSGTVAGIGPVLLIPELLTSWRVDLRPVDGPSAPRVGPRRRRASVAITEIDVTYPDELPET
jgi:hypothetical protein